MRLSRSLKATVKLAAITVALSIALLTVYGVTGQSPTSFFGTEEPGKTEDADLQPAGPSEAVEFERVTGVGFDQAPSSLGVALDRAPFAWSLPGHVPVDLQLWRVDLYKDSDTGGGNLELYWIVDRPPDGSPKPALRISWSNARSPRDVTAQLPPVVERGTFEAAGLTWSTYLIRWRDFDMFQARTYTPSGILVSSDIRVMGMDGAQARAELQKVLDSLDLK